MEESWTHYYQDELDKYFPAVNHVLGIGFPKGQNLLQWLKNKTAEESDKILKNAGERGSRVHDAIRQLILGKSVTFGVDHFKNEDGGYSPLTPDEWRFLISWSAWCDEYKPQVLKHETAVYNKKFGYAGTVDFIGTILVKDKRVSALLDWKTSGAIYDEYKLQTAAYAACMKTKPTQEFYTGVVRLGTRHKAGYEVELYDRTQTLKHFKQFLTTKDTYYFINGKDWKPNVVQIPMSLQIQVPIINNNGQPKQHTPGQPLVPGVKKTDGRGPERVRRPGRKVPHKPVDKPSN